MQPTKHNLNALVIALAMASLAGCVVGPDYRPPCPPPTAADYLAASSDEAGCYDDLRFWWGYFNDPTLNQLVAIACRQSIDLREAYWRVMEARSLRGVVRGDWFPQGNATGSYDFKQFSANASQFAPQGGAFVPIDLFSLGFDAAWELNVFGQVTRAVQAATADLASVQELFFDVKVTLLSDIATNYVQLRVLQQRLVIARRNLEVQRRTLENVQRRSEAQLVGQLDVAQAESNVYNTAATIPPIEEELQITFNRLSVLLGESPNESLAQLVGIGPVPLAPPQLCSGVPADLLRRRPDVRQKENEVAAASARIGVAVADLYPRFTINGTISVDSRTVSSLFMDNSLAFAVGPAVNWKILNFGRVWNNIEASRARHQQSIAAYQKTVLSAIEETENALVSYHREIERADSLALAAEATERSVRLSAIRYTSGLIDFVTVLDAQRQLLTTQDQLASSQGAIVLNVIRLYKALGGGWNSNCCVELGTSTTEPLPGPNDSSAPTPLPADAEPPRQLTPPPELTPPLEEALPYPAGVVVPNAEELEPVTPESETVPPPASEEPSSQQEPETLELAPPTAVGAAAAEPAAALQPLTSSRRQLATRRWLSSRRARR